MRRTRTSPKTRPPSDASTHAANASRDAAARLFVFKASDGASGKRLLPHGLAGAGDDEVRHRGVGTNRGAVEDGLVLAHRHLASQAKIRGYRLARVPALGYKDRDEDHVPSGYVLDDLPDLRLLVQESHLDQIVDLAFPDAFCVEVDNTSGVLVQVRAVPE